MADFRNGCDDFSLEGHKPHRNFRPEEVKAGENIVIEIEFGLPEDQNFAYKNKVSSLLADLILDQQISGGAKKKGLGVYPEPVMCVVDGGNIGEAYSRLHAAGYPRF